MTALKDVDLLTKGELKSLAEECGQSCVSIFMPTHRIAVAVNEDPIRLGKLLKEAEEQLRSRGMRAPEVKKFLKAATRLSEPAQSIFWKFQGEGLALFVTPSGLHYYRLPFTVPETVRTGERLYVKPLFRLFSPDVFYVLAFGHEELRLFQAGANGIRDMAAKSGDTLTETLKYGRLKELLKFHQEAHDAGNAGTFSTPAYEPAVLDAHDEVLRYLRSVNGFVTDLLKGEEGPLVLAGIKELFPVYRQANTYPHLISDTIPDNNSALTDSELYSRAWALVSPAFQHALWDARKQVTQLRQQGRVSTDLVQIVRAAHDGRIFILFLPPALEQWGTYEPITRVVRLGKPEPGNIDLLDLAALQVLLTGGRVYSVEPEGLPDGDQTAAVFRY